MGADAYDEYIQILLGMPEEELSDEQAAALDAYYCRRGVDSTFYFVG